MKVRQMPLRILDMFPTPPYYFSVQTEKVPITGSIFPNNR